MKRIYLLFLLIFCSLLTRAQIAHYTAEDIIHRCSSKDTVYIVNFWATWCAPCVAELPEFNKLNDKYSGKPVKVLLVSLDFKSDNTYKLEGFIKRKNITPEVVWLSDSDPNVFIPKIENSWGGSIPATVIVHPGKQAKKFIEGSTSEREVSSIVNKLLD